MDPHSRATKKNASHGNEVLLQDTTHLVQRQCYKRGSPCQNPAGNRTTQGSPDHRKKTQTEVVWICLPLIRSGQNHLARHSEMGRRQGRQKKKWEDNIREWTGLEFAKSQRAAENREKWRKLVLKSFVVPQLPPLLREGKRYVSWGSSPFSTGFARLNLFSLDFSLCKCHSGRSSGNTAKGNNSRSSSSSGSSSSRCCCYSSSSE